MTRGHQSWRGRAAGIAVAAGLLALSGCNPLAGREEKLPEGFFRVYADVRVKATGEIVKIDYVASCGAIVSSWSYTTSSVTYGMAPHIMLMPTGSGEMIGVRTPEVCDAADWQARKVDGEIVQNPPDDFLPLIMWYPDADNIGFAIGYLSDKAYESPYAKIELLSSGIAKSNLEEWRAWKAAAEAAFKPVGALPGPWGHQMIAQVGSSPEADADLIRKNGGRFVDTSVCYSVGVIMLPEGNQEILNLFPDKDKEWINIQRLQKEAGTDVYQLLKTIEFNGAPFEAHRHSFRELGVRRSTGGGAFLTRDATRGSAYHDRYPIVPFQVHARDDTTGGVLAWRHEILFDDNWNGFGICGTPSPSPEALRAYSEGKADELVFSFPKFDEYRDLKTRASLHEELVLDGSVLASFGDPHAMGFFLNGEVSPLISRSGQVIPDCCSR